MRHRPNSHRAQSRVAADVWIRDQSRQFVGWVVFWHLLVGATPAVMVSAPFWAHRQSLGRSLTLAVLGGLILASVLVRAFRIFTAGLLISADEVVVRGIYRTQRIPVDDVHHFEEFTETWIRLSTQSVRIRRQPRGKVRVTALQSPPYGGPARPRWTETVKDLNALVTAARHRDPAR